MAFIASILSLASQPTGTLVLQNTSLMSDAFVLEELTSGVYSIIPADEYRVKPSGFIVKRSEDDDGNGVDWSAYTDYYATGYLARPDAIVPFVRERVTFAQVELSPPTDQDNALDLELAYGGLVRDLISGAGAVRIDENGLASGDVNINQILRLGHGVQTKRPGVAANVDNASGTAWTTPNNVKRSDENYASTAVVQPGLGGNSDYLWLDDFHFRIPQAATIVGIAVNVESYHDTAESDAVTGQLVKNGSRVGDTDSFSQGSDTSESTQVLGGATSLWGSEWGSAEINDADFGVALWIDNSAVTGGLITNYVDSVTITVYYRTATGQTLLDALDNYVSGGILFTNDSWFSTAGAGLPYGSCWGNEIGWSQASAAQNTWYKVSDTDVADGLLNLVTHDGSGKLTVSKAGKYKVDWALTVQISASAKHVAGGIGIDGTIVDDGQSHAELAADTEATLGGTAILTLAASGTVELMARTIDTGTPNVEVHDMSLAIVQIGA